VGYIIFCENNENTPPGPQGPYGSPPFKPCSYLYVFGVFGVFGVFWSLGLLLGLFYALTRAWVFQTFPTSRLKNNFVSSLGVEVNGKKEFGWVLSFVSVKSA
jgi:hypothetical protein